MKIKLLDKIKSLQPLLARCETVEQQNKVLKDYEKLNHNRSNGADTGAKLQN